MHDTTYRVEGVTTLRFLCTEDSLMQLRHQSHRLEHRHSVPDPLWPVSERLKWLGSRRHNTRAGKDSRDEWSAGFDRRGIGQRPPPECARARDRHHRRAGRSSPGRECDNETNYASTHWKAPTSSFAPMVQLTIVHCASLRFFELESPHSRMRVSAMPLMLSSWEMWSSVPAAMFDRIQRVSRTV